MNIEKKLKKHSLWQVNINTTINTNYKKNDISKILPHRNPMLLIDKITRIDLKQESLEGVCEIKNDDVIFKGHFPKNPVYPGVLQIEMMGQLGLCLAYFLQFKTTEIKNDASPIKGLFTKIHNAGFVSQIYPGDKINIISKMIECDEFLGLVASQIFKSGTLCSYSILEVYFDK